MFFMTRYRIKRLVKKLKSMQQFRIHNQPTDEQLKKEIDGYHKLAEIFHNLKGKKKFPFAYQMERECYRAASAMDDSLAEYTLGKALLDEANFRRKLQGDAVFASLSNERQMNQLYEEAIAYLIAAEKLNHVEAKRLHGLCYINGWGLAEDKKHGFELILDSIEQENSWDKVPQIFAAMGLNKPEFYSALTQARNNKH